MALADSVREGAIRFMDHPLFEKTLNNPPVLLLAFICLALAFALVSPVYTLVSVQLKDWFKKHIDLNRALRWFNAIYSIVWIVMIALLLGKLYQIRNAIKK